MFSRTVVLRNVVVERNKYWVPTRLLQGAKRYFHQGYLVRSVSSLGDISRKLWGGDYSKGLFKSGSQLGNLTRTYISRTGGEAYSVSHHHHHHVCYLLLLFY